MNWFKGSIPEAIGASRMKRSIFVVVVTADEESSQQLLERLEDPVVSRLFNSFVSINLKNGSTECTQFSQLYPIVVLPAIYMIGLQGSPLEVIGGLVDTSTLLARAQSAVDLHNSQIASQPEKGAETKAVDDSTCSQETVSVNSSVVESTGAAAEALPLEARLEKANELLSKVREKKMREEKEREKEKERERRELGKQLQQLKDAQRDREQRELAEQRQKEKRQDKEALDKIRQQIAQDRADRAARFQNAQVDEEDRKRGAKIAQEQLIQEKLTSAAAARSAFARLQFRLPDGSTRTEQFDSDVPLSRVTLYVDQDIRPPFRPYKLCTTFPRQEFSNADMNQTLRELGLSPSAALLIVPTGVSSSQSVSQGSGGWFASLWARVWFLWNWIWVFVSPTDRGIRETAATETNAAPQVVLPTNNGAVRRRRPEGNVRRLADGSDDGGSDDNATWNGNSTQQL